MGCGPVGPVVLAGVLALLAPAPRRAAAQANIEERGWRVAARDTRSNIAWDVRSLRLGTPEGRLLPSSLGCRAIASSALGDATGAFARERRPGRLWTGQRGTEGLFFLGIQCERPQVVLSATIEQLSHSSNFADNVTVQVLKGYEWRDLAGEWAVEKVTGTGLVTSTWRMGILEVVTCHCAHSPTVSPVELRAGANGPWQRVDGPFYPGVKILQRVPPGLRRVELRIRGNDGWCISDLKLDGKRPISGLPVWLDDPCAWDYSCHNTSVSLTNMGCSKSYIWQTDELPEGVMPSHKATGCSNWPLLLKGNYSVEESEGACAVRCLRTPLCTGFQFQPYAFCAWSTLPQNACVLWEGECIQRPNGCFDQYALKPSFVHPLNIPVAGRYVTFPRGSMVPVHDKCIWTGLPGLFSWERDDETVVQFRLTNRTLAPSNLLGPSPIAGSLELDGVIRWSHGAVSFPVSRIAKLATNETTDPVLKLRTCDLAGAGTTTTLQYRVSSDQDWLYLGAFFERNQVYSYAASPSDAVQLRALRDDNWCVSSISLGGVEVRDGLPLWLQRPPVHTHKFFALEGNVWRVEGPLPRDVALLAKRTSCSNWDEAALGRNSVETSVSACAARCRAEPECRGFSFLPYVSCNRGWWSWGTCGLRKGGCEQEPDSCFDQYRLYRGHGPHPKERRRRGRRASRLAVLSAVLAAGLLFTGVLSLFLACGWARLKRQYCMDRGGSYARSSSSEESSSDSDDNDDECSVFCWEDSAARQSFLLPGDSFARDKWQDPAWAAISLEQLEELYGMAMGEFGSSIGNVTMYDVNDRILQPLCDKHHKCYAHVVNKDDPLRVNVFVSHAWAERFQEFVESVRAPFIHWTRKPTLWICATALIQSADTSVVAMQVGLGDDPREAPFTRALARAEKMLVVRNSACDLYDRIWCCWELHLAVEIGLVHRPGSLLVTGPRGIYGKVVDIATATATNDDDKQKILGYIRSTAEGYEKVNKQLTEIRSFVF